ncbi:MAG: NADPH-dependent 7-cyano-7-deazaguanine reductase QueF [Pseudomonadota bacterium]|nr:NADPH-dependent 7-cyano-7-deazaguanine reductase QueF [Pseudomonadota bacterium]
MNTAHDSLLGQDTAYPQTYDPSLLFPIARSAGRDAIGINTPLPFIGHDRWHAYELSWLDPRGKPQVATATIVVPCDSPSLIESKSLKLYLNSLNAHRFDDHDIAMQAIASDLSRTAGARVDVQSGLPVFVQAVEPGACIDDLDIAIDDYGPPDARHLLAHDDVIDERLSSQLLKSNCPVTAQPDWASLHLHYRGPRIDRAGLLRYLLSFRNHAEFHEQCVERIFIDVLRQCRPQMLSVQARYTRRGGLDINPWRATPGTPAPPLTRDLRQ